MYGVSVRSKIEIMSMLIAIAIILTTPAVSGASTAQQAPAKDYSVRISAGEDYHMVILDDNSLWGWGNDGAVHLGLHYSTERGFVKKPAKIMDNAKAVFTGFGATLVIKTDNTLWGWGDNMPGVGEDRLTYSLIPVKIMDNVISAASGDWFVLVVKADGTLWGWGQNMDPILKAVKGDFVKSIVKPVKLMSGIKKVAAHGRDYCVLKKDGTLLCTGPVSSNKSIKVNGQDLYVLGTGVRDAVINEGQVYYIKNDYSLWGIGNPVYEAFGMSGINTRSSYDENPLKIMDDVVSVATSTTLPIMAVKKDGSLMAWGNGWMVDTLFGRTPGNKYTYKPAILMKGVRSVSSGPFQMLISKTDGSVWTWGFNNEGGIGDGRDTSSIKDMKLTKLEFSSDEEQLFTSDEQRSKLLSDWIKGTQSYGEDSGVPRDYSLEYNPAYKSNWSGSWNDFTHGYMVQKGKSVTGFDYWGNRIFSGTVNGNRLKGYFYMKYPYGIFELYMSPDGNSFSGLLFYDSQAEPMIWEGAKAG